MRGCEKEEKVKPGKCLRKKGRRSKDKYESRLEEREKIRKGNQREVSGRKDEGY
jgi:hypothetical protein